MSSQSGAPVSPTDDNAANASTGGGVRRHHTISASSRLARPNSKIVADLADEESPAEYVRGGYLPIAIDDLFCDGKYVVVRKLGCVSAVVLGPQSHLSSWGHFSTVWLAKDTK